ncbi:MAG: PQQ-dependent sugar dehydrogenase, partial [Burkholderiales bacterium]|nr:PQQ-dependent sugar dehydrogenase [Burkholderiales bacterium]
MNRIAALFTCALAATQLLSACNGDEVSASPAAAQPAPAPAATPSTPPPTGSPSPTPSSPPPPSAPPPAGSPPAAAPPPAAPAPPLAIDTNAPPPAPAGSASARLVSFATGFGTPWAMTFLPDGQLLVTQKGGTLVLVSADGSTKTMVSGVPTVDARDQGGLLDVALDPQFATDRRVYLTISEPGPTGTGTKGTAVARAELNTAGTALVNLTVILQQLPKKVSTGHYGSRLAFRADGSLFVTLGERQSFSGEAQSLTSQLGKVVRINTDGQPLASNPMFSMGGLTAAIWSYGHRNPQAATINPATGDLWVSEHGPQGGDEVNLARPGPNFGWPTVSYGCNYGDPVGTACRIGGGAHTGNFTPPLAYWYPVSIAPGGMAFYTGSRIPTWQGNLFVGGLNGSRALYRLVLNGNAVTATEVLFAGQHEWRDVRLGPDGYLYVMSR